MSCLTFILAGILSSSPYMLVPETTTIQIKYFEEKVESVPNDFFMVIKPAVPVVPKKPVTVYVETPRVQIKRSGTWQYCPTCR